MSNEFADPNYEQEQQFILRLPQNAAIQLAKDIDAGLSFKDSFTIDFKPDLRHTKIRYNNQTFYGKIVDLPCIVESMKTTDRKTFYKTADISQMMICSFENPDGPLKGTSAYLDQRSNKPISNSQKEIREFQYLHGITPPLKNVLRRRFRKTCRKRFVDMPKIESEVKQLLKQDIQSESVFWEVIWSDPPKSSLAKDDPNNSNSNQKTAPGGADDDFDEEETRGFLIDRKGLFGGEISSSEDSDDDADSDYDTEKKTKKSTDNQSNTSTSNMKASSKSKSEKLSNTGLNLSSSDEDRSHYIRDERSHIPCTLNESSLDAMIPNNDPIKSAHNDEDEDDDPGHINNTSQNDNDSQNPGLNEDSQEPLYLSRLNNMELEQSERAIIEENNQDSVFSMNSNPQEMGADFFDEEEFIEAKGGELLDTNEDALMEFPSVSEQTYLDQNQPTEHSKGDQDTYFQFDDDEDKLDLV